eukprot:333655-Ditylum_brightwellii.AAC.1
MEIVEVGMKSTLVSFMDEYYNYNGVAGNKEINDEDIGLSIEGYESSFLADTVASCIFKMTTEHFTNTIICGIYRDDGLVVFNGQRFPEEIQWWLHCFQ